MFPLKINGAFVRLMMTSFKTLYFFKADVPDAMIKEKIKFKFFFFNIMPK